MPSAADPTFPPVHVDGFDELSPIGRGGFSYVFSARQRDFNRRVALKVLSFGLADERERHSFERECRAMGLVSQHPHIVTVFNAAFTTTKQPCIVMELYTGGTLGERLRRDGPLPVATALDVGVKIAGALQTAHDRGLLHRDIKPHNLFVSEFGEPALGDFGISTLDDERTISGAGGLTIHYAPPEVLEGAPATPSSDVYSLAATLHTLIDGSRPFASATSARQSVGELARRIMLDPPPRVARPDVPRSLVDLLGRAMSKSPGQRPASAAALGRELQEIQVALGLAATALPIPTTPPVAGTPGGGTEIADGTEGGVTAEPHGGHTITVPRPSSPGADPGVVPLGAPPEPVSPDDRAVARRVVIGTVAAVVALLAVLGLVLVFGGSDSTDTAPTTEPPSSTSPDDFFGEVDVPAGVAVTPGSGAGQVVVSWRPVGEPGDGTTYLVQRTDVTPPPAARRAERPRVLVREIEAGQRPCFAVRAVSPDGKFSQPSATACL